MVKSEARTPEEYIEELSPERREAVSGVRRIILDNLPAGYEEGMLYGVISYHVPLERYPDTHNKQPLGIAALASRKNYMSLYLNCVYADPEIRKWFEENSASAGKKLDMGKSCVRFKKLEDLPLEVVGQAVSRVSPEEFIEIYERSRAGR